MTAGKHHVTIPHTGWVFFNQLYSRVEALPCRSQFVSACLFCTSLTRKPAGDRVRQLLRRQAPPAKDHRGRLRADVHRDLHHRSASLHHRTVSEKTHWPPAAASGVLWFIHPPPPSLCSYEFETSVRWVVNSTANPSPCSSADSAGAGRVAQVPDRGENLHGAKGTTCTFCQQTVTRLPPPCRVRGRVQPVHVDLRAPGERPAWDRGDPRPAARHLLHR